MTKMAKSEWIGMSVESERSREAARSWFCGAADEMTGPSKANILTRTADDATLKLRALFTDSNGQEKELVRTFGKTFSVSIKRPTTQKWV